MNLHSLTSKSSGTDDVEIQRLKSDAVELLLNKKIDNICRVLSLDNASGSDRLMAMQVVLLQEQNTILKQIGSRPSSQIQTKTDDASTLTAILGGVLLGQML